MSEAWDTSVVSRLHLGGPYEALLRTLGGGAPALVVTAPTVLETVHGLARRARVEPSFRTVLAWYGRLFSGPRVHVLATGAPASILAGELRALHPLAPPATRGNRRGKPDRRIAWILDIQIAATAWAAGYGIATHNRSDFEVLRDLIEEIHPGVAPLAVVEPPDHES